MEMEVQDRRPIRARDTRWAVSTARYLQRKGFTPNTISLFSIVFAAFAAFCLTAVWHLDSGILQRVLLLLTALGIQGRLICNLLDGMVAVEGGLRSSAGAVFNELPDRISDTLLLLALGYSLVHWPSAVVLGWAASLFAIATAYVRLLGGTCGLPQRFTGPMAKQHRMALLTLGLVVAALVPQWGEPLLYGVLVIIVAGGALTSVLRTRAILKDLATGEAK